jgi:hypothetical protein
MAAHGTANGKRSQTARMTCFRSVAGLEETVVLQRVEAAAEESQDVQRVVVVVKRVWLRASGVGAGGARTLQSHKRTHQDSRLGMLSSLKIGSAPARAIGSRNRLLSVRCQCQCAVRDSASLLGPSPDSPNGLAWAS